MKICIYESVKVIGERKIIVKFKYINSYFMLGKNGKLLFEINPYIKGFAKVMNADTDWNFIDVNGKIISKKWFDWVGDFNEGIALVKKADGKLFNFIDRNGKLISDEWLDWVGEINDGLVKVILQRKKCYMDRNGIFYDMNKKRLPDSEQPNLKKKK